jgi:hypothetical protein
MYAMLKDIGVQSGISNKISWTSEKAAKINLS